MRNVNIRTPFQTIIIKEFLRFIRIWGQTVVPPAMTMALYFIIFGQLIGERIGEMEGFSYIDFIVPGLILMAVITNSYANVVSSFFQAKYMRNIEELLTSPVPNWVILAGYVGGGVARGLTVGVLVTIVAIFFADIRIHSFTISLAVFILTSILFSLAGFINAVYAKSFDDISIVPTFVLTPLTYLGGVFYSMDLLPDFWEGVSRLNPLVYVVNGFRYGVLGVSDVDVGFSFAMIVLFTLAAFAFCMYLLHTGKRLRQ